MATQTRLVAVRDARKLARMSADLDDALDADNPREWFARRIAVFAPLVREMSVEQLAACRRAGGAWLLDRMGVPKPPPRKRTVWPDE